MNAEKLSILLQETSYNCIEEQKFLEENLPSLNADQSKIYTKIIEKLHNQESGIIFVDAPGGTGKTYLLNLILARVRSQNNIAIAVASSGSFFYNVL